MTAFGRLRTDPRGRRSLRRGQATADGQYRVREGPAHVHAQEHRAWTPASGPGSGRARPTRPSGSGDGALAFTEPAVTSLDGKNQDGSRRYGSGASQIPRFRASSPKHLSQDGGVETFARARRSRRIVVSSRGRQRPEGLRPPLSYRAARGAISRADRGTTSGPARTAARPGTSRRRAGAGPPPARAVAREQDPAVCVLPGVRASRAAVGG